MRRGITRPIVANTDPVRTRLLTCSDRRTPKWERLSAPYSFPPQCKPGGVISLDPSGTSTLGEPNQRVSISRVATDADPDPYHQIVTVTF